MQIKKITQANKNVIADLNTLLAHFPRDYNISPGYLKELIRNSTVFGLFDQGKIVGSVTLIELYKLSGHKASVEHLIVHKDYRGKGLGRMLMSHVIGYAKKKKMQTVFLTTDKDNPISNALYRKLGFELTNNNFYQLDI